MIARTHAINGSIMLAPPFCSESPLESASFGMPSSGRLYGSSSVPDRLVHRRSPDVVVVSDVVLAASLDAMPVVVLVVVLDHVLVWSWATVRSG